MDSAFLNACINNDLVSVKKLIKKGLNTEKGASTQINFCFFRIRIGSKKNLSVFFRIYSSKLLFRFTLQKYHNTEKKEKS